MYKIVICDDEGKTTLLPFSRDLFTIGREEGNTIRLTDRNVSRRHARLFRKGQDRFFIEDLGGRNATRLDGRTVGGDAEPVQLEQRISVGDYKISITQKEYKGVPLGRQMDPKVDKGVGKVTPHARIVMTEGPTPGLEIDLTDQLYVIGRSERANVNIEDPSISRAHARIEGSEDQWTISDLDSINGIHINGEQKDDYQLRAGDVIDFGKIRFRFVASGEPYDFSSAGRMDKLSKGDEERDWLTLVARGLTVLVLAGMAATWLVMRMGLNEEVKARPMRQQKEASFDDLVQEGEAQMQARHWEEAARLFAQAQKINFDSTRARDLKKKANMEVEAAAAVEAALSAKDSADWPLVAKELAKIPPDSYYHSLGFIATLGERVCEELLFKAEFMISSGDESAGALLSLIGALPSVSADCLEKRTALEASQKGEP